MRYWKNGLAVMLLVGIVLASALFLSSSASMSTVVSPDGWGWQNPLPQGNHLWGVWGTSSSDVFAVGDHGTILHYDGSAWSAMSSGTSNSLWGVWGTSSSDVFAVGDHGTILHYDGSTWSAMSSGTSNSLGGVWGSSSSDVFAVGDYGTILHYDGSTWSAMSSGTSNSLGGVWGSSSSDVFAVCGYGTILHYNGSTWSAMSSGDSRDLYGVWGSSYSDVFAVGEGGAILHYREPAPGPTVVEVEGATLTVGGKGTVDIWVKNVPEGEFGLGAYDVSVYYDPAQVRVTGVSPGDAPFNSPIANIFADHVSITQFSSVWPGPFGDVRIADLEFDCLGAGNSSLSPVIHNLANVNGDPIVASPMSGMVRQVSLVAKTFVGQERDSGDNVVVLPTGIVRVKDPVTGQTVAGVHIGCYEARATYSPAGIQMLAVRPGDPPFDSPVGNTSNARGETGFAQCTAEGAEPPVAVGRLVPRLIGCADESYQLEVTFDTIADTGGNAIPEETPQRLIFRRGDIQGDGDVDIVDAMFGAQYLVGIRPIEQIRPLNMASVKHDGDSGDKMTIVDCMFIAQYRVGIRDCYFNLVP